MRIKTSISRVAGRKNTSRPIRFFAALSGFLALLLVVLAVVTLLATNRLIRSEPKPLDSFSSNILPDFSLATFPSLDEQTQLSGWFFPVENPISTVIIVHDQGLNRLQFGLDSAFFYQNLIDQGFCVLAFDLRNSGQSGGGMSGYGYAEWADVLAAIRYVRKHASTHDVLLYSFGSGVSAALLAMDRLPAPGPEGEDEVAAAERLASYPKAITELGFDQSYVRGLLLDTPCESADDYIRAVCRDDGWLGRSLLQYTVPYAIRLSAGGSGTTNLAALISRLQVPVFLAYSQEDSHVGTAAVLPLIQERQRLHPDTTIVFAGQMPGYTAGFLNERSDYLAALHDYLQRFFSARISLP